MTWFTRYLPIVLAVALSIGCFIAGVATHTDVSNDWLAFAGSLIGAALAALVGFWLIVVQERRVANVRRRQLLEALTTFEVAVNTMVEYGLRGRLNDEAAYAVHQAAVAAKVFEHARRAFGVTDVATVLQLENLSAFLAEIDWKSVQKNAGLIRPDNLEIYFNNAPDGRSRFDYLAEPILLNIADIRATLV